MAYLAISELNVPDPSRDTTVDALVGQAKEAISKANYEMAVELLRQAVRLAPEDSEACQLLARTEEASRRHRAALERYEAGLTKARQIEGILARGELGTARTSLEAAIRIHGEHEALTALERRLAEQEARSQQRLAAELITKAEALFEKGDWRGALKIAEQSQRFGHSPEAQRLRERAEAELAGDAERRHYQDAIVEAQGDVERFIEARELPRAGQRLRQAIDQLGNHESFDHLTARLDKAKADLQFRQRLEWAERRANEAARLLTESEQLSRTGSYQEAIERLEAARELDPSHPEIEEKLAAARTDRERQIAAQEREEALSRRQAEIKSHLDALRLDAAAQAIDQANIDFGEPQRFAALGTRLERLRAGESIPAEPQAGTPDERQTEAAILLRQRILADAYSWQQTLLYPFRGWGPTAYGVLVGVLLTLDLLTLLPHVGWAFKGTQILTFVAALGLAPLVMRSTLDGRNLLPEWSEMCEPSRWSRDTLRFCGFLLLAGLPLLVFIATRQWHFGLDAEGGWLGWLVAAFLCWLITTFVLTAGGAVEAFGYRHIHRLSRHREGFAARQLELLTTAGVLFVLMLLVLLLHALIVPKIPWLGLPAARAIEAYGLLAAPHSIGVLTRRHRLELSRIYG